MRYGGFEQATIDEFCDLRQLAGIRLGADHPFAHAVGHRNFFRWKVDQADQNAAALQGAPRALLRFRPNRIDHDVGIVYDILELCARVIDHRVGPKLAHEVDIMAGCRANHMRATRFCELHREVTNPTARAMEQHGLPAGEVGGIK